MAVVGSEMGRGRGHDSCEEKALGQQRVSITVRVVRAPCPSSPVLVATFPVFPGSFPPVPSPVMLIMSNESISHQVMELLKGD